MKRRRSVAAPGGLRIVWILAIAAVVISVLSGCVQQPGGMFPAPAADGEQSEDEVTEPLRPLVNWVVMGLEIAAIVAIVGGAMVATATFFYRLLHHESASGRLVRYREHLGQIILLGLEFLVAADIIGTVAVRPSFRTVGALAFVILVRTFLSFTLEVETTGRWPWQRRGPRRE